MSPEDTLLALRSITDTLTELKTVPSSLTHAIAQLENIFREIRLAATPSELKPDKHIKTAVLTPSWGGIDVNRFIDVASDRIINGAYRD